MEDYSFVEDNAGIVHGIWLRDPSIADNPFTLIFILTKHKVLSAELTEAIMEERYRMVENRYDDAGGCFLMFGVTPAPGELG